MARTRITCTLKQSSDASDKHLHIVQVGDGARKWTIREAYTAIDKGDEFYTEGPAGKQAKVEKFTCRAGHTTPFETLRSSADKTTENNLDNLKSC